MSSENVHGSFSSLYNQQLGLHMLVQHSTMFDISARAFQRPFALALLTPHCPTSQVVSDFQNQCIELIRPLLACNRSHFQWVVRHCIRVAENTETNHFDNYYALSKDGTAPDLLVLSNRLKAMAQQAKVWYNRFLEGQNGVNSNEGCECGCDPAEFSKFVALIDQYASYELLPLLELAPCAGNLFASNLEKAYKAFTNEKRPKGILFSYNTPLIRSFFGANSQLDDEQDGELEQSGMGATRRYAHENSLRSIGSSLTQCLFPLFAGEKIAILASTHRECTGIDLLNGLNSLRVCKRHETPHWLVGNEACDSANQLVGRSSSQKSTSEWASGSVQTIVDLNHHKIIGREYSGKFLPTMNNLRKSPSDLCIKQYIVSILTDVYQWVILAKHTSLKSVVHELRLSSSDQLILINCLLEMNISKYSSLKKEALELLYSMPYRTLRL